MIWVYNIHTRKTWTKKFKLDEVCEEFSVVLQENILIIRFPNKTSSFDLDGRSI